MINTLNIKQEQLANGYFEIGSGPEKILIMGSCRVCPYVEYFHQWNVRNNNRFTIYSIDPFNWNWDAQDNRVDYNEALAKLETDEKLLAMLGSINIFIHEYYQNSGMFNVNKEDAKNIYKFGIAAETDICIPNFNDLFILFADIISFDLDIRKKVIQDYNVLGKLSEQTLKEMYEVSQKNLRKFHMICNLSDLPEMSSYFNANFKKKRFWHSYNHVTKHFTFAIFMFMQRFLDMDLKQEFLDEIFQHDLFANSYTSLTEYDLQFYNYDWGEPVMPLRNKL